MEYLNEPFVITMVELDTWDKWDRRNSFFEIVCILDGEGDQYVNNLRYPYQKGNIFLLPATDCHTYIIRKKTRFLFLKFANRTCMERDHTLVDYTTWCNRLNFIIGNYNRKPGELIRDENDKNKVIALLEVLQDEYGRKGTHGHLIMQSTLVAILSIIARNIEKDSLVIPEMAGKKIAGIIQFVQHNLVSEEKISIKYLASEFHIAETYFSEYFKRNSGETFQDFVLKSKLKIAEARVYYTRQSFKEIAYELGFTDSSHLNKMMKKYHRRTMSEIRKASMTSDHLQEMNFAE